MEAPHRPGPECARAVAVERRDPVLCRDAAGKSERVALGGLRVVGVEAVYAVERAEPEPPVVAVEHGADPEPLTVAVDLDGERQRRLDLSAADPPELRSTDPERSFGVFEEGAEHGPGPGGRVGPVGAGRQHAPPRAGAVLLQRRGGRADPHRAVAPGEALPRGRVPEPRLGPDEAVTLPVVAVEAVRSSDPRLRIGSDKEDAVAGVVALDAFVLWPDEAGGPRRGPVVDLGAHPEVAVSVLDELAGEVAGERGGVEGVRLPCPHRVAVPAPEPLACGEPEEAALVLQDLVDGRLREVGLDTVGALKPNGGLRWQGLRLCGGRVGQRRQNQKPGDTHR